MKNRKFFLSFAFLLFLFVVGCGNERVKPVAIDEGIDKCEVCNMGVSDNQFSTELILKDGRVLKFDDAGCMHKWLKENQQAEVKASFVRDFHHAEWVESEKAAYVFDASFMTPMAYGVYVFKDRQDAEKLIQQEGKGKLLSYSDLLNHDWKRNADIMKELKKKHGQGGH